MKKRLPYSVGSASDRGIVREQNEDTVQVDRDHGAFAVIDGMGGHAGGQMAAKLALEQIRVAMKNLTLDPETRIRQAIARANQAILAGRARHPEFSEMACVLTVAQVQSGTQQVTIGHVGDTRLYKIRQGQLTQITEDHSPVGELVRRGLITEEDAMHHPNRNLVLRDVGSQPRDPHEAGFIDTYRDTLEPDAALLLCSDGLCDQVPPSEILAITRRHARTPQKAADALVERANQAGGKDNVSVVLITSRGFARGAALDSTDSTARLSDLDEPEPPRPGPGRFVRWGLIALALAVAAILALRILSQPDIGRGPARSVVETANPQAALQAAAPGTVIRVKAGEYLGPLTLAPGVILRADPGVILKGHPGLDAVVTAEKLAEPAVIEGFTVDAAGAAFAVRIRASGVTLQGCVLRGASQALVSITDASIAEITGSTFETRKLGLAVNASALTARGNRWDNASGSARAAEFQAISGDYRVILERNHFVKFDVSSVIGLAPPAWLPSSTFDPPVIAPPLVKR